MQQFLCWLSKLRTKSRTRFLLCYVSQLSTAQSHSTSACATGKQVISAGCMRRWLPVDFAFYTSGLVFSAVAFFSSVPIFFVKCLQFLLFRATGAVCVMYRAITSLNHRDECCSVGRLSVFSKSPFIRRASWPRYHRTPAAQ